MQILTSPVVVLILLAVLFIGEVVLFFIFFKFFSSTNSLFKGLKGSDVIKMLAQTLKRSDQVEDRIKILIDKTQDNTAFLTKTLHKVGIVRFNPFSDMGGEQSFCVAFLDADDSGVVLTSLYSKDGTRTYIKQIIAGKSEHSLSQEEKKVIEEAIIKANDK